MPSGLDRLVVAHRRVEDVLVAIVAGVPVVVVYDSGGIRKGELPGLGLNGAYEIRPDRSYELPEESAQDVAEIPGRLADLMGRVATTWGWD